jgi:hypothetical protein
MKLNNNIIIDNYIIIIMCCLVINFCTLNHTKRVRFYLKSEYNHQEKEHISFTREKENLFLFFDLKIEIFCLVEL